MFKISGKEMGLALGMPNCLAQSPLVVGGLLVVTGIGGTAFAFDMAPEIDPGSITSAMTLLAGSALLITGRRWQK